MGSSTRIARGFVHRDIKPANLLFDEEGRLRIADFGLARAIAEAAWTEPSGVVLGTARYASPEQAQGKPVDGKTDVYSLALVMIESVTGTVPFAADTTVATLMARIDALVPVPESLGPLRSVVERAGRPNPEERYDATALGHALAGTAERLPRPAPLPLVPPSPSTNDMLDLTTMKPAASSEMTPDHRSRRRARLGCLRHRQRADADPAEGRRARRRSRARPTSPASAGVGDSCWGSPRSCCSSPVVPRSTRRRRRRCRGTKCPESSA